LADEVHNIGLHERPHNKRSSGGRCGERKNDARAEQELTLALGVAPLRIAPKFDPEALIACQRARASISYGP
jgi:hypothetical protein